MLSWGNIKKSYFLPGGLGEFLKIAVPIIVSSYVVAVQIFTDRIFLSMYSQVSFAASIPAGLSNSTLEYLFLFTIAYVDVFIAQYYGKKEYHFIGPAMWQSIYLAIFAAAVILSFVPFAEKMFVGIGHATDIVAEEVKYFKTLCYGAFFPISATAFSGFYSGRGKTYVTLLVSLCGITSNIILDYCLIFGRFFSPELGITGAAWASNISYILMFFIYLFLVISKKNAYVYNTRHIKPNINIFRRLLKFGFPNGITVFFDMMEFAIFMLIIGTLGILELTASNIALSVYNTTVTPIIGAGVATSIMVGNYLGQNKASIAQKSVGTALKSICVYVLVVIVLMFLFSTQLISPFLTNTKTPLEELIPMSINLLRLLAVYMIFDAGNVIFQFAIKGAGDTSFVMKVFIVLSFVLAIIPTYLIISVFKMGIYAAWIITMTYEIALFMIFYFRYKSGKWKKMRVIDMKVIEG
ncbi:MAG: MATE family efflux transporter [Endomicrobium sp.]|jgi:MATE family multidrug resistance protein|nr:MATE family efflux transporter [Endomicrobium sp.]